MKESDILQNLSKISQIKMNPKKKEEVWEEIKKTMEVPVKKSRRYALRWSASGVVGIAAVAGIVVGFYGHSTKVPKSPMKLAPLINQGGPMMGVEIPAFVNFEGNIFQIDAHQNIHSSIKHQIGTYQHFSIYSVFGVSSSKEVAIQTSANVDYKAEKLASSQIPFHQKTYTIQNPNEGLTSNQVGVYLGESNGMKLYSLKSKNQTSALAVNIKNNLYMIAKK